jgi:6-pyruvoyltetrahydropterin/6-carboxytetrahydropterin synthase
MHEIQAEFTFAAAHQLPRYQGKCRNLHGHNYKIAVTLRGEPDAHTGMFVDLGDVENAVREHILARCDHKNLNDFIDNPTAEAVAAWCWTRLVEKLPGLYEVRIWEIPGFSVAYRGTDGFR